MSKVLIACEESQTVTKEMRALGIEAYSCDTEPCSGGHPEWHLQQDVIPLLKESWDMVIAFPPCTDLAVSGARHFAAKKADGRQQKSIDFFMAFANCSAPKFAIENPVGIMSNIWRKPNQIIHPWMFGHAESKKTCLWLKNLPPLIVNIDNIIPPKGWQQVMCASDMAECSLCGEPFCSKHNEHYADCACIGPTEDDVSYKQIDGFLFATREYPAPRPLWENQTPSGQNKLGPSPERAKIRSKTYAGIAKAMATQWGTLIK